MSNIKKKILQQKLKAKPVFHERDKSEDAQVLSQALIKQARKSGNLKLCGRALTSVPEKVWNLLEFEPNEVDYSFKNQSSKEEVWWDVVSLKVLDLSNNSINCIPPEIQNVPDLQTLNLSNNRLATLPTEICYLNNLTTLNLSHNIIENVFEKICSLKELCDLNLSYNKIQLVPNQIYELNLLQTLDLSHNEIESLPPEVGFLTRLNKLNLNNNKLTELPSEIVGLRALTTLDITNNHIKSFPDQMNELSKLKILYAQHNDIEDLPKVSGPFHLKELYLGNNFIKEITEDFCMNTSLLTILDLRDNKITNIPDDIAMMQHLIRLDLTNNDLSSIPTSLATLSHLQNLQIEGNKIRCIRREVIQRGTQSILKTLREKMQEAEMDSVGECLKSMLQNIPENYVEIPDRHAIKVNRSLNLSGRDMSVFPDKIYEEAKNASVASIDFSKNKIFEFPTKIFTLCDTLQDLSLKGNLLKSIPDEIGTCIHLRYLDLSQNMISGLPDIIGSLKYMKEVILSCNRFTSIPECLYSLPALEILLIRDNKINELIVKSDDNKKGLSSLKSLAVLDISNNNISQIPAELGNMKQIRTLEIQGNLFKQPRLAIVSKGTESIMSYLRGRISE